MSRGVNAARHLILCGAAKLTSRQKVWQDATRLPLDVDQRNGNINLRIADITDKMASSLPAIAGDLVELATYVYCADQAIRRGGPAEFEYGQKWRRALRFEVPVRCPEVWIDPKVVGALKKLLGFLSDDDYQFGFSKLTNPPPFADYLEFNPKTAQITERYVPCASLPAFVPGAHQPHPFQERILVNAAWAIDDDFGPDNFRIARHRDTAGGALAALVQITDLLLLCAQPASGLENLSHLIAGQFTQGDETALFAVLRGFPDRK